jgi:hypothetical protein
MSKDLKTNFLRRNHVKCGPRISEVTCIGILNRSDRPAGSA